MYFRRGKGAKIYRSSGFKNFGCIGTIIWLPVYILMFIIKAVINYLRTD